MKNLNTLLRSKKSLKGQLTVPSDKSIAQRSVMLAAVAEGSSHILNFPFSGDPQSTLNCVQNLGIDIEKDSTSSQSRLIVNGKGFAGLKEPQEVLDFNNSGTGLRLMMGLLSGVPREFFAVLSGDQSLRRRPMSRVVKPLRELGAEIYGRDGASYAPLSLRGQVLNGGKITNAIASAQLKSAILLSGLNAKAQTLVTEPELSRDHTEIMLKAFGANIEKLDALTTCIQPSNLKASEVIIPGDFSSACFFLVAASIVPGSHLSIKNVGLNPTRTAALDVLKNMGANIHVSNRTSSGEQLGDVEVSYSSLSGTEIKGKVIPNLIDEIPILCLAAAQAKGETIISGAEELRVKESDRIKAMFELLKGLGVPVEEKPDGLIIQGLDGKPFEPKTVLFEAGHDHRIAMTAGIAALLCTEEIELEGAEWANVSFPGFFELLEKLSA